MKTNKRTAHWYEGYHERYLQHLEDEAEEEAAWYTRYLRHLEEEAESGAPDLPAAPRRSSGVPKSHHQQRRKPSVRTLIQQAEKAGKPVTSVITPDGTTLKFGESESTEAANPWLADLNKVTKQ